MSHVGKIKPGPSGTVWTLHVSSTEEHLMVEKIQV